MTPAASSESPRAAAAAAPDDSSPLCGASSLDGTGRTTLLAWLLAALAAMLWFATLDYRDLIHPDEGRYAEIAREMLVSGDWISPRLNGILYFEKPPLQYWATAVSFALFGLNEFAARLWPALTGALGVAAVWAVARRTLGARVALHAACVLGSSAWWLANSHFLNLDMGVAVFMSLAMLGFWWAQRDEASARERRLGMYGAWAAMALAVLSKGLIGIVLPGAVLVAYAVVARDFVVWRRMHWLGGIALFLAIAAPWFVVVSMRNPDFARFFFVHEHFERFLTTAHRRSQPIWFFLPVLAIGLMPWSSLLPGALALGWRRQPGRFQPNRLLLVWALLIFVFFSLSGSKLPSYILPVFPALALLVGQHAARLAPRRLAAHLLVTLAVAGVLAIAMTASDRLLDLGSSAPLSMELVYRNWLLGAAAVLGAASVAAALLARRGRIACAILVMAFGALIGVQAMMLGHQSFATLKSSRAMVEAIRDRLAPAAPFYSVGLYDQTLPFYLRRTVTLVEWQDEFEAGLRIEPWRSLPDLASFEAAWRADVGASAVMKPDLEAKLQRAGLPMKAIYRDDNRVVVVKR
ncbi:MAG: phospholipid carrier-dependent glycosyltransferase [Gammaproteobacteria bacterium]